MKTAIIKLIQDANINECGWVEKILVGIKNEYAAGYLTAKTEVFSDSLAHNDEEFRREFLRVCSYDSIWF